MSTTDTTTPAVTGTPSALQSEHGSTRIAETVVSKIAGLAAREVSGIYALGGGAARAFGALRERIPGGTTMRAVSVVVLVCGVEATSCARFPGGVHRTATPWPCEMK